MITLNNLSAKYESNAEELSNYIKHLQGIDEVIATIILFREHDYNDNNLGIIEKDGEKLLGKIDHDQSDFIKHFNCAINRLDDAIHLEVVLDSFAKHKILQSLFNRESVEKKIIELSRSLSDKKEEISKILDENINFFLEKTSSTINQLLNYESVMLNNSNEKKTRHYFIAKDQEDKKNIQDIYYFKLDDDRFYPYKKIDSLYGVFKKLEGPSLTFNELYIQEFFKRVEYCLRMEVSKNHTNQINQEKSKESPSHPVSTPREDSQNGTKTTTAKVVSLSEFVIPISGRGINNKLNPQTTHHRPQSKPNIYKNKGFEKEIMVVVGAIVGTIIGATIAYFAGAALPIIAAIAVFSAAVGALIGYGIAEICEKVSREKQNDPKIGALTALGEVHTTELLNDNVDVAI